jgi:hypothetical protein
MRANKKGKETKLKIVKDSLKRLGHTQLEAIRGGVSVSVCASGPNCTNTEC